MRKKWAFAALLLLFMLGLTACASKGMDAPKAAALSEAFGGKYTAGELLEAEEIKPERELSKKFKAIKTIVALGDDYGFIAEPVGYNGPVKIAVAIDGAAGKTVGISIIDHDETDHYVRDMESGWFVSRFAQRDISSYLKPSRLEAFGPDDIVCITGATVSTEAIINGVNAAMGFYREQVLKEQAPAVAYAVKFERSDETGPVETGSLAIRVQGVVVGELSLDEIRALPSKKRTLSIRSTQGETTHSFRGALLCDILNEVDPELLSRYTMAMAVGVDDYISGIRMDEVLKENSVFVMYEDNDLPLKRFDGSDGGMRIVVIDDVFGQRFTNYLLEIKLE